MICGGTNREGGATGLREAGLTWQQLLNGHWYGPGVKKD